MGRNAQVQGRSLEHRGHEAVDRFDLEIGVAAEELFQNPASRPGQGLRVAGDDLPNVPCFFFVPKLQRLEPVEDLGPHLPRGVAGEGDGQNVAQVVRRLLPDLFG